MVANRCSFKIGDCVKVREPFGTAILHFSGVIIRIDSTSKNIWKQIEPMYTIKKTDGIVQCDIRESWMTLIDPTDESQLTELGFLKKKDYIHAGVAEHVKAADDMIYFLEIEASDDIAKLEMAAKGWLLLGFRAAGVSDKISEDIFREKLNWAMGSLSREDAAEYYKEYKRKKSN